MPYSHRPAAQPRVIGLTMMKNEQDIIEPMIRHNAALLDALIILDNGSVDDTRRIAVLLARELGNVVITDSARFGYTQGERMTRLLNATQSSYFADFILFLDADEFIGAASRAAFHAELAKIPQNGIGAMPWSNFVLNDGNAIADPPHGMTHHLTRKSSPGVKSILRLDGMFRPDLTVGRGNHVISSPTGPLPAVLLAGLPLWHFPVRGTDQLTAKALVGWLACLAADPQAGASPLSHHWRGMFRRIADGTGFTGDDLRAVSLHYGDASYALDQPQPPDPPIEHDPAPIDTIRRYSTGKSLDPLVLVARSWEQSLLSQHGLFAQDETKGATVDVPPFRFLMDKYQPASVLDIGGETGLDLELFARLGVRELTGVGALPRGGLTMQQATYTRHDPSAPFSFGRTYALILCLNTAANQAPSDPLSLIVNADRHAEAMIAFSLDEPTVQNMAAWLAAWQQAGWVPNLMETLALRCLASSASLRRGLIMLRRSAESGTEELLAISRRPFRQPPTQAAVYEEPLTDAAEASWFGYAA